MKSDVVVVGAGGHAKVCIELLQAMGEKVAYCIGEIGSPEHCLSIPVLKGDETLRRLRLEGHSRLFVAVGSNKLRSRLADFGGEQGYQLVSAISPTAIISPTAKLGAGVAIMAGVVINADVVICDLAIINTGAIIDHDCFIGQAVHISPQCALAGNVRVGTGSFLGIGSKVIPDIDIGEDVVVGAGAAVIADLRRGVTAVGVPAKAVR